MATTAATTAAEITITGFPRKGLSEGLLLMPPPSPQQRHPQKDEGHPRHARGRPIQSTVAARAAPVRR
jgi:hypothetical protein